MVTALIVSGPTVETSNFAKNIHNVSMTYLTYFVKMV
jgi:hypothetical protein